MGTAEWERGWAPLECGLLDRVESPKVGGAAAARVQRRQDTLPRPEPRRG
ncbi:MAG: hypothetical protein KA419_18250 [Acidobacteria bacterium]|nr:hypothetical protein [Acidobacteriota bacterium]